MEIYKKETSDLVVSMSNNEKKEVLYNIFELIKNTPNRCELSDKIIEYLKNK